MTLERALIQVENIEFGPETSLQGRILVVDKEALRNLLQQRDDRIQHLQISLAKPNESARIICVKDVIEPRCKVAGERNGEGRVHVLKNVAVVTCGKIVGYQEGIIDMSGAGALYSPFSRTLNVVLEIDVVPELTPHQHEEVVRNAGLTAASFLGEASRFVKPDTLESFTDPVLEVVSSNLPRIAYVYMLLSQGLLHDTYLFGQNVKKGLPCIISPQVLMDNAITSGNCVSACDKNTTWHHQNNPVNSELLKRHGKELNLAGVVLTSVTVKLAAKQEAAEKVIQLVKSLNARGAIISKEGFGNPDADQMMLIRGLEQVGIRTVSITDEYAGPDGFSQSLADAAPEADAVVSVGNANERIVLPPVTRLLGPVKDLPCLAGAYSQSLRGDGSLEIELQGIIGATNELGSQTLCCREV
ncbi:MAG: glycine/sarcosine/betaine reductase component B subunit [Desulfobulbales bacterium]